MEENKNNHTMTDEEKQLLKETASAWQSNANLFKRESQTCAELLKFGYTSIGISFENNAKILKALLKEPKQEV